MFERSIKEAFLAFVPKGKQTSNKRIGDPKLFTNSQIAVSLCFQSLDFTNHVRRTGETAGHVFNKTHQEAVGFCYLNNDGGNVSVSQRTKSFNSTLSTNKVISGFFSVLGATRA